MYHHSGANQHAQCPHSRNIIIKINGVIIILGQSAGAIVVAVSYHGSGVSDLDNTHPNSPLSSIHPPTTIRYLYHPP